MGKIVKYCTSCEEGFAEKFAFCPNCASQLQAFEMVSPIGNTYIPQNQKTAEEPQNSKEEIKEEVKTEEIPAAIFAENNYEAETDPLNLVEASPVVAESLSSESTPESFNAQEFDQHEIVVEEPEFVEEKPATFTAPASAAIMNDGDYNYSTPASAYKSDGFHITVIEEKNGKQRNMLLLGSLCLMTVLALGGTVYSLFNRELLVGSIEQGNLVAFVPEVEPVQMEEEPKPEKKDDNDGGGGGGGGKEEQTPVQKGRLATQVEKPLIAPSKNMVQVTNPTIKIQAATEGNNPRPITNEVYGLKNGAENGSDGMGSGGGMGSGRGRGMGSGIGTGEGSGIGSGSGSGRGTGNGGGTGSGTGAPPPPPPSAPARPAVTTAMRITSKPRANYTDAARQNQVQGIVTLRVTFLANGQIGSISPVSGLPYGLTEQAIAAARNIRFEPQQVNGVAKAVTKQVQYSFTIY